MISIKGQLFIVYTIITKLDGVGLVDKGPSTNQLNHFLRKKEKKNKFDFGHLLRDTWHMTHETWHMTRNT